MTHAPLAAGDLDPARLATSAFDELIADSAAGYVDDRFLAELAGTQWWAAPTCVVEIYGLDHATSDRSRAFAATFAPAWGDGNHGRWVVPETVAQLLVDDPDDDCQVPEVYVERAEAAGPDVIAAVVAARGDWDPLVFDGRDALYDALVADAATVGMAPADWVEAARAVGGDDYDGPHLRAVIAAVHGT